MELRSGQRMGDIVKGMDSDTLSQTSQKVCQNAWEHAKDLHAKDLHAGRCMRSARAR